MIRGISPHPLAINRLLGHLLLIIIFPAAIGAQALPVSKKDLKAVSGYLSGTFLAESSTSSDSSSYQIKLQLAPIMQQSKESYWLYAEQALVSSVDKPYRQKVYHLFIEDDTTIVSQPYELKNLSFYAGSYGDPSKLATLSIDSLISRAGCGVLLHKYQDGSFRGSTAHRQCFNALRGSVFATMDWVIYPNHFQSWERGWDEHGVQKWGPVQSGYDFLKKESFRPR